VKLVLKSPSQAPCEAGRDLSVVISFDGAATAGRACEVLKRLGRNLKKEKGSLFHQWWNIETLAFTSLRERAAVEAAGADLILLGLRGGGELPETVAAWIKRLMVLRKDRPGALLAILDSDRNSSEASQGMLSQLQQAGASGQMEFFATQTKEGRAGGGVRRATETARQFLLTRQSDLPCALSGNRGVFDRSGGEDSSKQLFYETNHTG